MIVQSAPHRAACTEFSPMTQTEMFSLRSSNYIHYRCVIHSIILQCTALQCTTLQCTGVSWVSNSSNDLQAALWDNAELLEDLVRSDQVSFVNSRDAWGRTPLHAAASTDASRCLSLLLQAGAQLDVQSGPRADQRVCFQLIKRKQFNYKISNCKTT